MNLEKRVDQLEQRAGSSNDFVLFIIAAMGVDPEKIGPERAIQRPVTGYTAIGRDRKWDLQRGESAADLRARMEEELRGEGHKVYLVGECYEAESAG
jgi:hypothetical protein